MALKDLDLDGFRAIVESGSFLGAAEGDGDSYKILEAGLDDQHMVVNFMCDFDRGFSVEPFEFEAEWRLMYFDPKSQTALELSVNV